jgi:AcrR family transcriptional regulator
MRRLAAEMGIQAPSLYKHFPDKEAITRAVYIDYLISQSDALAAALEADDGTHPIVRIVDAYRGHAVENRALYLYLITRPYPRREAEHVLRSLRRLWFRAVGDNDLGVAAYAFARGMAELELRSHYPVALEPPGAYRRGIAALVTASEAIAAEPHSA